MSNDSKYPARKRRADSFLGIHFDFHAGKDCTEIGKTITPEMIERIIDLVRPDYLQCDCKGHPGISSYPTKVGNPAPGFVQDSLRVWRDVTAKRGVALFMHYSGVIDAEAVTRHPSWARVNEKGKRDKTVTSVFGPYVDKLLIPQLKELSDVYDVDGVWLDGECWGTEPDYGKHVLAAFQKKTGITTIPREKDDPYFFEFLEFCREGFREYMRHYIDELHRHNPNFQIASNWSYTSFMPEPLTADVDFLSGDYPMQDSVNCARFEGRCLVNRGKPWDLMAWAFSGKWEDHARSTKNVPQLQQEAAVVLALGGGFQAYFQQKRDGAIFEWPMQLMAEVAKFCRARQLFCHQAQPVHQTGLLYSSYAYYRKSKRLFGPWGGEAVPTTGVLNALLDGQNSVEIVLEFQLADGNLRNYPLIVIPEWEVLEPEFHQQLLDYVRDGGNLLLIGAKTSALFAKELDITLQGEPEEAQRYLAHNGWMAGLTGEVQSVTPGTKARPFGMLHSANEPSSPGVIAATITPYGRGTIAGVFMDMGKRYRQSRTTVVRDFLNDLVRQLFPHPIVTVRGSHSIDVVVNRINGTLAVNLVNTAGSHHDPSIYTYDDIPTLGPLEITIRTEKAPTKVTQQPEGKALPHTYKNGEIHLTLPELAIHTVIVVE